LGNPGDKDGWVLERLSSRHDRTSFDCGNSLLNDWFKLRASQFEKRDLVRTYVATNGTADLVAGYYAISSHRILHALIPVDQAKGLPRLDVPVVLLGRLAVDRSAQGQGLGSLLLIDALRRAEHLAQHVGIRAVEVDAIDDRACLFYQKFGFKPLLDNPNHLFLSMHIIRKLGLPPLGAG